MFDYTGTRFNFTVLERVETRRRLVFCDSAEGEYDVSNVTFSMRLVDAGGAEVAGGRAEHGATAGLVQVYVPALEAGSYEYELVARAESGEEDVVLQGVVTAKSRAAGDRIVAEAQSATEAELRVIVPDAIGKPLVLKWSGGSFADGYLDDAQAARDAAEAAAERAEAAAETVTGIAGQVKSLQATLALVEGRIRSAVVINPETNTWWVGGYDTGTQATGDPGKSPRISDHNTWELYDPIAKEWNDTGAKVSGDDGRSPYIDAEGYWVDVDPVTGGYRRTELKAYGKDGVDGASVRRIIVGSKEELPEDGETCTGGFYYYVPLEDALPVLVLEAEESRTGGGVIEVNGEEVELPESGLGVEEAAEELAGRLREAFPEAEVVVEGGAVAMRGDVLYWQVQGLDAREWKVYEHVRMKREGYDVYAWLEERDGSAGWVRVGEANDIATREIYGLTKLGTDAPVVGGTPVGVNKAGEMSVPRAEWFIPGGVLPGQDGEVSGGAGVGFDEEGRMRVREADGGNYGVVKTSYSGTAEAPVVGKLADGRLGLPWADLNQAGAVKLGSQFGQGNPIPYRVGIGADEGHHLANNLVYGGALKHMSPQAWLQQPGVETWLRGVYEAHSEWFHDAYYMGLHTSSQFTQDATAGLILLPATSSTVGGVKLETSLEGERERGEATVVGSGLLLEYLKAHYMKKEEAVSLQFLQDNYMTKKELNSTYMAKSEGNKFAKVTDTWSGCVYLTEAEYNALTEIDPKIEYNILGNSR